MKSFLLAALLVSFPALAKEFEIKMKSISFEPKTLNINVGDSIKWKNVAYTDHSASSDTFDTGLIKPKASSKPVAFPKAGTYSYNCKIHGKTMSGTVVVGGAQ